MEFRDEEPEDIAGVREVLVRAFGRPDEAELVDRLRRDGDIAEAYVASLGGVIVGSVLFSKMRPDWALALAPVAVLPDLQRQAIGTRLIKIAIARLRYKRWDAVFVLGDQDYYGRFGFDVAAAAGYTSPYAGPHFGMLVLKEPRTATGALHHAPAFGG